MNEGKVVGLVCARWLLTALPLEQVTPSGKKSPLALHNSSKNDLLNHPPDEITPLPPPYVQPSL